jgi:hypothetical protein
MSISLSMGDGSWSDDAPRVRHHARKCAQQRLRAKSPTRRTDKLVAWPRARHSHSHSHSHSTRPTHPHLPSITRPRHLIRSPSNLARTSSNNLTMDLQQIRVQWRSDPLQSHQNQFSSSQDSQGTCGHFRLKQTKPPSCPCHIG